MRPAFAEGAEADVGNAAREIETSRGDSEWLFDRSWFSS